MSSFVHELLWCNKVRRDLDGVLRVKKNKQTLPGSMRAVSGGDGNPSGAIYSRE
jgi:hypothetical protein